MELFNKPDVLTLKELLNNKLFKIPDYQRPYSWTQKQRAVLFDDIKRTKLKNKEHFMSTIVYVKTKETAQIGSDEFHYYDIVDGQQRLTTLIILLKTIQIKLSSKATDEKIEKTALQDTTLVRGKNLVLLQTNHNERDLFKDYLCDKKDFTKYKPTTLPEKNLCNAFKEAEQFVEEWKNTNHSIIELLSILKNKLLFLTYDLSDESSVYTVFDVLNSRGLPVIYLDKAKSLFLSQIYEHNLDETTRELSAAYVKERWSKIYELMGIHEFDSDDVLKYTATYLSENMKAKFISSEDALMLFQKLLKNNIEDVSKISTLMVKVSEEIKELNSNPILKFFATITQLRFFYISVKLSDLDSEEKIEVLEKWQLVSFIIYGLYGKDSKYSVGDFIKLGKEIYEGEISPHNIEKNYIKSFEQMSFKNKILKRLAMISEDYPINYIEEEFEGRDCYKDWYEELRYLLYRVKLYLESRASKGKKQKAAATWNSIFDLPSVNTVEHIIPETPHPNWNGKIGRGNVYKKVVNRLGNLLLLPQGMNSECGQKPFLEKKEIYKRTKLFICDDVIYTDNNFERDDWNLEEIESREHRYFKIIKEIFSDNEE